MSYKMDILSLLGSGMLMLHNLSPEISYLELMEELKSYANPRAKVSSLLRRGDLIRVKKGIYVLGPEYRKPYSSFHLANIIYGPSYVSGWSAMSYHGMIPEEVQEVFSRCLTRNKYFETPLGLFRYKKTPLERYPVGVMLYPSPTGNKSLLIASPEKTLVEAVCDDKEIRSSEDIADWIASHRIELEDLSLNRDLFSQLLDKFNDRRAADLLSYLDAQGYVS